MCCLPRQQPTLPLLCPGAAGFPTAALSIVTLLYHALKPGQLSYAIAVTCLAITSATHITFGLLTVAGIVRRRIFVPDAK